MRWPTWQLGAASKAPAPQPVSVLDCRALAMGPQVHSVLLGHSTVGHLTLVSQYVQWSPLTTLRSHRRVWCVGLDVLTGLLGVPVSLHLHFLPVPLAAGEDGLPVAVNNNSGFHPLTWAKLSFQLARPSGSFLPEKLDHKPVGGGWGEIVSWSPQRGTLCLSSDI